MITTGLKSLTIKSTFKWSRLHYTLLLFLFFTGQTVMPTVVVETLVPMPHTLEKPPGKIMSKLMQSGLAQNWFFKKEEVTGTVVMK